VIEREALARYLAGVFHARVEILALQPLKSAVALSADTRATLIRFARTMLDPAPFDPETLPAMFGASR